MENGFEQDERRFRLAEWRDRAAFVGVALVLVNFFTQNPVLGYTCYKPGSFPCFLQNNILYFAVAVGLIGFWLCSHVIEEIGAFRDRYTLNFTCSAVIAVLATTAIYVEANDRRTGYLTEKFRILHHVSGGSLYGTNLQQECQSRLTPDQFNAASVFHEIIRLKKGKQQDGKLLYRFRSVHPGEADSFAYAWTSKEPNPRVRYRGGAYGSTFKLDLCIFSVEKEQSMLFHIRQGPPASFSYAAGSYPGRVYNSDGAWEVAHELLTHFAQGETWETFEKKTQGASIARVVE